MEVFDRGTVTRPRRDGATTSQARRMGYPEHAMVRSAVLMGLLMWAGCGDPAPASAYEGCGDDQSTGRAVCDQCKTDDDCGPNHVCRRSKRLPVHMVCIEE